MKTYLVGGAVRDQRLGLPVKEQDWVVTGATPEHMLAKGFKQVGKDFPVFLHPETSEEYALARTERKSGHGYHGFSFNTATSVSLEEDLLRRDLTINAMALSSEGKLIDPYQGLKDLKGRWLRHVSEAFAEDPLRVLRVARFAARFHWLGFRIADKTMKLMKQIVQAGEMEHLTPERVWKETSRAMGEKKPSVFFMVLRECGALHRLFPELDALFGVPQPEKYHPEIDTGLHTMMGLDLSAQRQAPLIVRFAVLTHDLGKGITPKEMLPSHRGHEKTGVPLVRELCNRLRVPNDFRQLALQVCEFHLHSHRAMELKPATLHKLFQSLNLSRKPEQLELFVLACKLDAHARTGLENSPYPQEQYLLEALGRWKNIDVKSLVDQGLKGEQIGQAIEKLKIQSLTDYKKLNAKT